MNSNGKIIFGGFIAVSVVVVFLLFSMQKRAQLELDIQDVQRTVAEKEAKIAAINSELERVKSKAKAVEAKNQLIPKLKSNLETTEQEKLIYIKQLDDFQAELQHQVNIAEKRLAEIAALQKQQEELRQLLAKKQDAISAVDQQKSELNATLIATLSDLEQQKQVLEQQKQVQEQTLDVLGQKDRVIQIYKEKLDKSVEEIMSLKTIDNSEQLNLKLVLDELAAKNQFVENLPSNCKPQDDPSAKKTAAPADKAPQTASNEADQALIKKLSLVNDALDTELREQDKVIADLKSKLAASEELSSSYVTESEQLLLTSKAKDDEIRLLTHKINNCEATLKEINTNIEYKEQALQAAKEQTQGIATPLTEKITGLELQLAQLIARQTAVTSELSQARATIATLQNDKQIITAELNSAKVALQTLQEQTDKLVEELKTANASLQAQESHATKLITNIDSKRKALHKETETNKELTKEVMDLKHALALCSNDVTRFNNLSASFDKEMKSCTEAQIRMNNTIEELERTVAEKEATIRKVDADYRNRTGQFLDVRERLATAGNIKTHDMATIHKLEARITELMEEIAEAYSVTKKLKAKNKELLEALNEKPAPEEVQEDVPGADATAPQEEVIQEETAQE